MAIEEDLLKLKNPSLAADQTEIQQAQKISSLASSIMSNVESNLAEESETQEMMSENISSMSKILKHMTAASINLAEGSKKLTIETSKTIAKLSMSGAKAIKDSAGEYAKVVGEDINMNRKNLMMTSLSTISPIAGYFATKIMETGVFRSAISKMKDNMGRAFSSIAGKFVGGVKGLFGRKKTSSEDKEDGGIPPTIDEETLGQIKDALPQAAEGGYVQRSGMVSVHAGEVIQPVDETVESIMSQVENQIKNLNTEHNNLQKTTQESFLSNFTRHMSITSDSQLRSLREMHGEMQAERRGIIKSFIHGFAIATKPEEVFTVQERQLHALIQIRTALVHEISAMKVAWQTTLLEHPTFRNLLALTKSFGRMFGGLIAFPFKTRGGIYSKLLPKKGAPLESLVTISGQHLILTATRLDAISEYTLDSRNYLSEMLSYFTGRESEEKKLNLKEKGRWSIFGKSIQGTKFLAKQSQKAFGFLATTLKNINYHEKNRKMIEAPMETDEPIELKGFDLQLEYLKQIRDNSRPILESFLLLQENNSTVEKIHQSDIKRNNIIEMQLKTDKRGNIIAERSLTLSEKARKSSSSFLSLIWMGLSGALFKITGFLSGTLTKSLSGLSSVLKFLGPAGNFITKLGGSLGRVVGGLASKVGAMIPGVLNTAGPLLAAGAIGYGVGTIINKTIVGPLMDKAYAHMDKIAEERNKAESERMGALSSQYKTGESITEKAQAAVLLKQKAQAANDLSVGMDLKGRVWNLTGDEIARIKEAQSKVMETSLSTYLSFTPERLSQLRTAWQEGPGSQIKWTGDPESYGTKRETEFLQWLQQRVKSAGLTQLSDKELAESYNITGIEPTELPAIVPVAKEKIAELSVAATLKAKETMEKLGTITEDMGKRMEESYEKTGNVISSSMSQATNNISNVVQNVSDKSSETKNQIMQPELSQVLNGVSLS